MCAWPPQADRPEQIEGDLRLPDPDLLELFKRGADHPDRLTALPSSLVLTRSLSFRGHNAYTNAPMFVIFASSGPIGRGPHPD